MIRRLRRLHQSAFVLIAPLSCGIFLASLAVREGMPVVDRLPEELGGGGVPFAGSWDEPDPLLYETETEVRVGGTLPEDARFVGALAEGRLLLADAPEGSASSRFLVYSLARQEVVEVLDAAGLRAATTPREAEGDRR